MCPKYLPYISFVCFVIYSANKSKSNFLSGGVRNHKEKYTENIWGIYIYIYIYGIYKEYIRNIHKYSSMSRNTEHRPNGAATEGGRPIGAPPKAVPVFLIINIYGYALYIPYIFHIYIYIFHIYFLAMFHIFSLVCFLIYGVKSRSGHD